MRVVIFSSLNYDYVYFVDHIVLPVKLYFRQIYSFFAVERNLVNCDYKCWYTSFYTGLIGEDGDSLLEMCKAYGVKIQFIRKTDERTGNAIIQVSKSGENSVVIFGRQVART